jgi:L-fucose mutarotase/ribose pyranase (RbsD/FucU family)
VAPQTAFGRVVPGVGAPAPQVVAGGGSPDQLPPVQRGVQHAVDLASGGSRPMGALERFAFYDAAGSAYAVVATGEPGSEAASYFARALSPPTSRMPGHSRRGVGSPTR